MKSEQIFIAIENAMPRGILNLLFYYYKKYLTIYEMSIGRKMYT